MHLIAIHAMKWKKGMKIKNFLEDDTRRSARLSISEKKLKDVVKKHAADIVRLVNTSATNVFYVSSKTNAISH